jgi:hypothetical protein
MMKQRSSRAAAGYLLICILAIFLAACSNSEPGNVPPLPGLELTPGDDNNNDTTPSPSPSDPSPITVVPVNIVASAGPIVAVRVGEVAVLDGSSSTVNVNGESLSFDWSFTHKPDGSNVELQNADTERASFTPDVAGSYMIQLLVSAAGVTAPRVVTLMEASVSGRYTGPYIHIGLSPNCVNCHNGVNPTIAPKTLDHLGTSNVCQACHTMFGFAIPTFVDHQEVSGNCSDCHNGVLAIGKSQYHVETDAECDDCHNTLAFLELLPDGGYDHSGISRACVGCHNGITATGKNEGHIDTASDCGYCHATTSFLPALFDHSGIENNCVSCHNGTDAVGQTQDHPATNNADCVVCHNTRSFNLGGVFDHSVLDVAPLTCETCHNDVNARGKTQVQNHVVTTADCGNCHNTESFVGAFVDHTSSEVTSARCDSCHDGLRALGMNNNHMPIQQTNDCIDCHTAGGTFTTGTFDHAGVTNNCVTCHDNVISNGKPVNHIPTQEDCVACHNTTDSDFAQAVFNHTDIVGNCASCHNNEISIGKPASHLPTTQDCAICHLSTDAFIPATFSHAGITDNCASCHDGRIALGKKVNHIPTREDCSVCHIDTNTGGFANSTFLDTVHLTISGGCEGCHNSQLLPLSSKGTGHLPTTQDCHFCHENSAFVPSIFNHTGITGGCESCHNGNFTTSNGDVRGKTPTHPVTNQDCGVCHNTSNFADAYVDHDSPEVQNARCDSCHIDGSLAATGKDDKLARTGVAHLPTNEDCRVCHVPGTFATAVFDHQGIVDNCASCHNGTNATGLTPDHVSILDLRGNTRDCSDCHNTTAFAGARFDHTGIVNNCASCHDGATAPGKPFTHIPTNADCSQCHLTTGFLPTTFDHQGIVNNCASCHDGTYATGKSATHVPTSQDCGVCHNTRSFTGATFDHSTVSVNTRCDSCHDGSTAPGKDSADPPHLPTTLDCRNCHTTATFVGGTWDHTGVTGNCASCHNGNDATGKSGNHFVTTQDCNTCHATTGWAPINYRHAASTDYPGDHNANLTCIRCHRQNNESITYAWPQYGGTCAACHAGDYDAGEHRGTLAQNADCGRSGCHRVSARSW